MDDWRSYDHVAAQYERANGSRLVQPARGLLELVGPLPERARVLDVGTGPGITAHAAAEAGAGLVVGIDPAGPRLATGAPAPGSFPPGAAPARAVPVSPPT